MAARLGFTAEGAEYAVSADGRRIGRVWSVGDGARRFWAGVMPDGHRLTDYAYRTRREAGEAMLNRAQSKAAQS